jgi:ATPase subunit of ABC transporter with duplicated ATPase domains
MLTIKDLSIDYAGRKLFQDVSLTLNQDARYGVVGANGAGKSTFMRIIGKQEAATGGVISMPERSTVGFLQQDHFKYENDLIVEVVIQGKLALWDAMQQKEELLKKSDFSMDDGMLLADLEAIINDNNGYTAITDAQTILTGLGISEEKQFEPLSTLSGGFKLRVLLAQTLFSNPDVLLLDEPTNHLDIGTIVWLEKYLTQEYHGVLLIISHDHHFLNSVSTHILDVDYGTITPYTGNFDQFVVAKELARVQRLSTEKQANKQIEHLKEFVDKFKAKASKAKQAQSRMKMIDKLKEELPLSLQSNVRAPFFNFIFDKPSGQNILKINKISKSFNENQVLNNIKFDVARGDHIGIIGKNGIGKSTLLKIILGNIMADHGDYTWGNNVDVAYFAQDHHDLIKEPQTLVEWLKNHSDCTDINDLRKVLGQMLFDDDAVKKSVLKLSGGEAARLLFAKIQLQLANTIILDEPTNHLDMQTIDALALALKKFPGTILLVSHNRDFLSTVCNRIIVLTPKKLYDYPFDELADLDEICTKHFIEGNN